MANLTSRIHRVWEIMSPVSLVQPVSVVMSAPASSIAKNISSSQVVKASAGAVHRINVISCVSTAGACHDCATVEAASAANKIATLPAVVGSYALDITVTAGLVVIPGALQVLAVHYS